MKPLQEFIIILLNIFYSVVHDYGLSIILLTVAVKLVFYPLTKKQFESMAKMKEIQPRLKKLQDQHKGNPQQLQTEMMQLYKKEGVNPLGGCLPLLVQMPFLIGLFLALNSKTFAEQVVGNAGFLWIADITAKHPNFFQELGKDWTIAILPILVGISTYATQKMMGSADPKMAPMMAFMPVLMVFISFSLPAGVLLYWASSNLITAWQQAVIAKKMNVISAGLEKEPSNG